VRGEHDGRPSATGVDVQTRVVHVFRYRQGQQVERWFYPDDQTAWDSIFGR
jgi:ketosteroid isomerase-like protein